VRDADATATHVARTVDQAADLARRVGFELRLVDAGGGLGIPYVDGEPPLDLDRLAERLATLAAGWCADPDLAELSVLLEPGRYLVGPAGLLMGRVLDAKEVGDRPVAMGYLSWRTAAALTSPTWSGVPGPTPGSRGSTCPCSGRRSRSTTAESSMSSPACTSLVLSSSTRSHPSRSTG
jgi:hypothetical protein